MSSARKYSFIVKPRLRRSRTAPPTSVTPWNSFRRIAGVTPAILLNEFHGVTEVGGAVRDLLNLGFTMNEYFRAEDIDGKARYRLIHEQDQLPVRTLRDVLKAIRTVGRKG